MIFYRDFSSSPVFKTSSLSIEVVGSIYRKGAKIQQALRPKKKKKTQYIKWNQYCNKFKKEFLNGPH